MPTAPSPTDAVDSASGPSVSIICVYNDAVVRERCLDRSVERHRSEAPGVELILVDNTENAFSSAGAALNHGASLAKNEYLAFVHQDVYLHSLTDLERAAGFLAQGDFGILGSVGIRHTGEIVGRMRDRVLLVGENAPVPVDVDSLDEVLFMIAKSTLEKYPLAASPELAWHAYAVEYGLRMRSIGKRAGALNISLTHNSLTVNLDRLDVAHATVASLYPQEIPIETTCGTVRYGKVRPKGVPIMRSQRWRYRWLRDTMITSKLRGSLPMPIALSDIRHHVDEVLDGLSVPLHIINLDPEQIFSERSTEPTALWRNEHPITVTAITPEELEGALAVHSLETPVLITNIDPDDLGRIGGLVAGRRALIGYHQETGIWIITGDALRADVDEWRLRRARPLGTPPRTQPAAKIG